MSIPDKAVEAAARAYYEGLGWDWDDLSGWDQDQLRERDHAASKETILREFRAALEAAEPYLTGGLEREDLEAEIKDALEDLGIVAYPTNARNDAEEPVEVECVAGHVAGYILALQRSEVK